MTRKVAAVLVLTFLIAVGCGVDNTGPRPATCPTSDPCPTAMTPRVTP